MIYCDMARWDRKSNVIGCLGGKYGYWWDQIYQM